MLAVAVEGEGPGEAAFEGAFPSGDESGAFAGGLRLVDDVGASLCREARGIVGGGVINDDDRGKVAADSGDERGNGGGLIEARDDGGAL